MNRLAIPHGIVEQLMSHLGQNSDIEDGAFCLLREGHGIEGVRLLATDLILPTADSWEDQGTDVLRPSAKWISAAISRAIDCNAGLLFVHSHPKSEQPLGLSPIDEVSFDELAKTIAPILNGPFAAAVIHPTGWAGVVWGETRRIPINRIVSVGRTLCFLTPLPCSSISAIDDRQADALGVVHDRLRVLTVGLVGCGGIGSPVAEKLDRMGLSEMILIDNDLLDAESNVRRVFGSKVDDLRRSVFRAKVDVVRDHLEEIGLGVRLRTVKGDVRTEKAFRNLLDCDVVISATDTHSSRAVINELASTYLLPVIDVGVRVALTPVTPCLWCRGIINGNTIRLENLPTAERGKLRQEGYVTEGLGEPVPSVIALTVLAAGW